MKYGHIIFALVISGLSAIWFVPATIWGFQITKASEGLSTGETGALADLAGGPAPLKWFRTRKDLHAYFTLEEITPRRQVGLTQKLAFEDLLAPGEEMPPLDLHPLYAVARAPSLLIASCPELLTTLATACDVGKTDARIERDGSVRLTGALNYVPAYPIGDPSTVKSGEIIRVTASLTRRTAEELTDVAEDRAIVFDRAIDLCAAMAQTFGNCVVAKIDLSSRHRSGNDSGPPILDARSTLAVYADKTLHRKAFVQAKLREITEDLMN
jgi:hypothetical protein